MTSNKNNLWIWRDFHVSWQSHGSNEDSDVAIVLIHGFGACKEHWRHNQLILGESKICYALDLIGFGQSSQPQARLEGETEKKGDFSYRFENWSNQVADFCKEVVKKPVILVGNSIGGVIALRASQILMDSCNKIVLINCAQRTMDDKRLKENNIWMQSIRPLIKLLVKQRWLSSNLFYNAANPVVINRVLNQAYPTRKNIDANLIEILLTPAKRPGAMESFRGFINLFDDYLAPDLMKELDKPVHLIWGEQDPWEPLQEARNWSAKLSCIRSLEVIPEVGHCPHDEAPEKVNSVLLKLVQQAT